MLTVKNLSVRYGDAQILSDLSFEVNEGDWLMIVGPNGAGKSTTLSAIVGSAPHTGSLQFEGRELSAMRSAERARKIGILAQSHHAEYAFTVEEIVRLGRYAYTSGLFNRSRDDEEDHIAEALEMTGLTALRRQRINTLSGGELQRTFLAQVFAQEPRLLLLDEPTNHLDLIYQKQVFAIISDWLKTPGRAVASVVHDLSLARAYGTRALLLDHGRCAASGTIDEIFRPENINGVYGMDVAEWMRSLLRQWEA
ncbi:MAG: ABC transporter ATP-binding protein [Clostridia bacterium]|nr:ABC transporter ATP-binding protein [Clostridia bacterium]